MTSHGGQRLILPRHCLENYQFLASQACINNRNYNSRETTGENFSPRIGKEKFFFLPRICLRRALLPFDHSADSDREEICNHFCIGGLQFSWWWTRQLSAWCIIDFWWMDGSTHKFCQMVDGLWYWKFADFFVRIWSITTICFSLYKTSKWIELEIKSGL